MPVSEYTPVVSQVAGFIRARTKTHGGAEAGTFNPEDAEEPDITRPTQEQVEGIITDSLGKVSGKVGVDLDEIYWGTASHLVALYSAMITELTYWPEQVNTGRSTYPQLKELWDEEWAEFLDTLGIGEDGGAPSVDAGFPSYGGFPTTAIGMETPW